MKKRYDDLKEIEDEIIRAINSVTGITAQEIKSKKELSEIGIDSFSLLEILYELENRFDINLREENLVVDTIEELTKLIKESLEKDG